MITRITVALITGLLAGGTPAFTPSSPDTVRRVVLPTTPCQAEDGPGPCFWDAGRRGNGRGFSFWIDRHHHFHYLNPRKGIR